MEERKLAAIVVGDIVGYSAMVGRNEPDTLAKVFAFESDVLEPGVAGHGGRIVKTTGDGFLAEFPSALGAVAASIGIQETLAGLPDAADRLTLRMGVHVGDVAVRQGDIYGDGVNVAARLEQAAEAGGILVSGAVHDQLTGHAIAAFAEVGPLALKNIARPVVAWRWVPGEAVGGSRVEEFIPPATKPAIAVLPFDNLSGDREQDFLADGIVQDLITNLSRFHWFRVIARTSVFPMAGKGLSTVELGARLGANYLLQGSVRRSGDRIRVSVELIDAANGTQVWGDRIDRELEDVFDLQDAIVQRIVGVVVPEFVAATGSAQAARPTLASWELSMKGWHLVWRLDGSEKTMLRAREHFHRAIDQDPRNGVARSGLAFTYGNPFYLAGLEREADRALEEARQATELDPRDASAWCLLGAAYMWKRDQEAAARHLRRAIALNPSLALAHIYLATVHCWDGDVVATDARVAEATRLSPADPMLPFANVARAMARFATGEYVDGLEITDSIIEAAPDLPSVWRVRAACLESQGDHGAACAAIDRMMELAPITIAWARANLTPLTDPELWDAYLSALQRAGIPAG